MEASLKATLLISFGILMFLYFLFVFFKTDKKYDVEVTGIVYQISRELSKSQNWKSYITIRFLTNDNLWITEKRGHGFYPSLYKEGEKVKIKYVSSSPDKFVIVSYKETIGKIFILVIALILIIFGLIIQLRIL